MKNIDIKSIIIGALLTSTSFLGVAATSPTDKWDDKQEWVVTTHSLADIPGHDRYNRLDAALKAYADRMWRKNGVGREAFAMDPSDGTVYFRKRIK